MEPGNFRIQRSEDYGYIIHCNLEYHNKPHNEHKDLSLASEHYNIRLYITLFDKEDCVVHTRN